MEEFTVFHKLVQDSLSAISKASKDLKNDKLVIYGGIATQLYAYEQFPADLRPTWDIDVTPKNYHTKGEFRRRVGKNIASQLTQYGATVNSSHRTYEVKLNNHKQKKPPFYIHLAKLSRLCFKKRKEEIEKKVRDSNTLVVPYTDTEVCVVRPEELVRGKVARLANHANHNRLNKESLDLYNILRNRDWGNVKLDLEELSEEIYWLRESSDAYFQSTQEEMDRFKAQYAVYRDFYDIVLLSEMITEEKLDFDDRYYTEISEEVNCR